MNVTPAALAGQTAAQIIGGLTNTITRAKNAITDGTAPQGPIPAVSGSDIAAALGTVNVSVVTLLAAALGCNDSAKIAAALAALA